MFLSPGCKQREPNKRGPSRGQPSTRGAKLKEGQAEGPKLKGPFGRGQGKASKASRNILNKQVCPPEQNAVGAQCVCAHLPATAAVTTQTGEQPQPSQGLHAKASMGCFTLAVNPHCCSPWTSLLPYLATLTASHRQDCLHCFAAMPSRDKQDPCFCQQTVPAMVR